MTRGSGGHRSALRRGFATQAADHAPWRRATGVLLGRAPATDGTPRRAEVPAAPAVRAGEGTQS
ncbi:hypothetical protein [Nonomuraea recticatena]|uniref:hypothetical protein n=1 Tax=Nonomuraea recticatena TaxID=46178 RepID=UPI0031F951E3